MKLYFILFLFFLFGVSFVNASITSNQFQINFDDAIVGTEYCRSLSVYSDEPQTTLSIEDVWAQAYTGEGSEIFAYSALDHQLEITHPDELFFEAVDSIPFNLCITAHKSGNYKGKLVFDVQATSEGSSSQTIVQPWIRIKAIEVQQESPSSSSSDESSEGDSSSQDDGRKTVTQKGTASDSESTSLDSGTVSDDYDSGITGGAINEDTGTGSIFFVVLFMVVVVVAVLIYRRRKR